MQVMTQKCKKKVLEVSVFQPWLEVKHATHLKSRTPATKPQPAKKVVLKATPNIVQKANVAKTLPILSLVDVNKHLPPLKFEFDNSNQLTALPELNYSPLYTSPTFKFGEFEPKQHNKQLEVEVYSMTPTEYEAHIRSKYAQLKTLHEQRRNVEPMQEAKKMRSGFCELCACRYTSLAEVRFHQFNYSQAALTNTHPLGNGFINRNLEIL